MKILAEGAVPMPPPLWPVGSEFECDNCHCRFEIETGDPFVRTTERRPGGKSTMTIICPTCETTVCAVRPLTSGPVSYFGYN